MFKFKLSKTMRDVQWSFISLATASLSHLLLRIVLGRELGPDGLGVYTLVFTIYMFGMLFAAFGMGSALIKYVAEFHDDLKKKKEYISSGMVCSLVTGLIMGIILYVFSELIAFNLFNIPAMEDLLKITAICYPFIALHKVALGTLNGLHQIKKYALLDITLNGLILAISVFFVMVLDLGTQGAVYGFVLPTILVSILSFSSIKNYITRRIEYNNVFRDLTWFGFYVVISGSVGMLYHHVDSLMLGYFMSETDVGHYAIAAIFIQGLALIPNAVQKITTPRIAYHYGKKDYDQILQLIKNVLLKTYAITFILFIFLVLSGKYLIIFLFTDEFLPAYIPLVILLIGYAINAPIGSIGGILGSIGKINISFRIAVLTSLINVMANLLLIPKHGLIGAASATSFSFILGTIIYYFVLKRIIRNWT